MLTRNKLSSVFLGQNAENIACRYLEKNGLTLIEKNYKINGGEIDLIMNHLEYTVFIEVKMRTNSAHGNPIEQVTQQKKQRIIRTATHYLFTNDLIERADGRFDVVGIDAKTQEITWIKNAFEVEY